MSIAISSLGEQTDSYSFRAGSLEEALQQMDRLGPRDGDGHHSASCDIQAAIQTSDLRITIVRGSTAEVPSAPQDLRWNATAQITQATLGYRVTFRFPQWSNVSSLPRPVQAEWQRYTGRLWVHERGHVQAAMPVMRRYVQQYQNLRIAGAGRTREEAEATAQENCRTQIPEVFGLFARDTQQASNRYDQSTRHGRNQGARLRTGSGPGAPR